MKKTFLPIVQNNQVVLDVPGFKNGEKVSVVVERLYPHRSSQQNRYYRGVVLAILAEETGHTPEELHLAFRSMFLSDQEGSLRLPRSTAVLTTEEFSAYVEKIRNYASFDLATYIPAPNEVQWVDDHNWILSLKK